MSRRPDSFGLGLALGLAAAFIGGGVALVACHVATPWELAIVLVVGAILFAGHQPRRQQPTIPNSIVHGAGRPAQESEARAAASGERRGPSLDDRKF